MPKNKTTNLISQALGRGTVKNTELNGRLRKYKLRERKLSEKYGGGPIDQERAKDYQKEARQVGDAWIELVVDMASFYGEFLDRKYVKSLRETMYASIDESTVV